MNINWLRRLTGREHTTRSGSLTAANKMALAHAGAGSYGGDDIPSRAEIEAAHLPTAADLLEADLADDGFSAQVQARKGTNRSRSKAKIRKHARQHNDPDDFQATLRQGLPVTLGDLKIRSAGWLYRDIPVMVFAVDVEARFNPTERQAFFYRVHLTDCCAELHNPERRAMVATDYRALQNLAKNGGFELCHDCLRSDNYLDYSHRAHSERDAFLRYFSFPHYVMTHGSDYFPDRNIRLWPDRAPLRPLAPAAQGEPLECTGCGWTIYVEDRYLLSDEQCDALGLSYHTCVLCAQRQADVPVILPGGLAETLYRQRFTQLRPAINDWQTVRLHLDKSWHGLTYCLQRQNIPLPALYTPVDDKLVAPMAWPDLKKAVTAEAIAGGIATDWEIWSRAMVLETFLG